MMEDNKMNDEPEQAEEPTSMRVPSLQMLGNLRLEYEATRKHFHDAKVEHARQLDIAFRYINKLTDKVGQLSSGLRLLQDIVPAPPADDGQRGMSGEDRFACNMHHAKRTAAELQGCLAALNMAGCSASIDSIIEVLNSVNGSGECPTHGPPDPATDRYGNPTEAGGEPDPNEGCTWRVDVHRQASGDVQAVQFMDVDLVKHAELENALACAMSVMAAEREAEGDGGAPPLHCRVYRRNVRDLYDHRCHFYPVRHLNEWLIRFDGDSTVLAGEELPANEASLAAAEAILGFDRG